MVAMTVMAAEKPTKAAIRTIRCARMKKAACRKSTNTRKAGHA